ncbi:MAG: hypothetical protein LBJ02_01350 [Bifidobacteriaceae bacterium]|jgi:phospholipase/lecithinase/hemolysin|nr:hypothetical protein [Bifidobacteriaceae bacterium]
MTAGGGPATPRPEHPWSLHTFILPFIAEIPTEDPDGLPEPARFCRWKLHLPAGRIALDREHWKVLSWTQEDQPPILTGNPSSGSQGPSAEEAIIQQYNAFQYFTKPARDMVFGYHLNSRDGSAGKRTPRLVRHFELQPDGKDLRAWNSQYVIRHGDYKYELDLVRVRLVTYSTNVSLLVLETEYYGPDHSLADIERINEYGRRVCFPFLSGKPSGTHPVTADYISIRGLPGFTKNVAPQDGQDGQEDGWVADFVYDVPDHAPAGDAGTADAEVVALDAVAEDADAQDVDAEDEVVAEDADADASTGADPDTDIAAGAEADDWWGDNKLSFSHLMEPIKGLLSQWSERTATSRAAHLREAVKQGNGQQYFLVRPVVDDRMFVCCLYRSDAFSQECSQWVPGPAPEQGTYAVFSSEPANDPVAERLYAFSFIDVGSASCTSRTSRQRILQRSIYDRWIGAGTLYGITPHSFVCLTSESWEDTNPTVVSPFSNMYLEMVVMALAQRASVLSMSAQASRLSSAYNPDKRDADPATDIAKLQQQNARVQNQIMLSEVTTQEQGVEMFTMMRQALGIEANNAELTDQLSYLYKMSSAAAQQAAKRDRQERKEAQQDRDETNKRLEWILALAVAAVTFGALGSAIVDIFGSTGALRLWAVTVPALLMVVAAVLLWLSVGRSKRNERRRRHGKHHGGRHPGLGT